MQSAANMSRREVIKRIENILGVKKVGLSKKEMMHAMGNGGESDLSQASEMKLVNPLEENHEVSPTIL